MFIYEGNRTWVEQRLRELVADEPVKAVCEEVGAKLDGTDSVLTLCAADDQLALRLGPEKTPLRAPEGTALVKQPWARHPGGIGLFRLKNRRKSNGVARSPEEIEALYESQKAKHAAEWGVYAAQMRLRDAGREAAEGNTISPARLQILARAAAVTEEQRAAFRRRTELLKQRTEARIEALDAVGHAVNGMFGRLDPEGDSTGGHLVFTGVGESFELSEWTYKLLTPVPASDLKLRIWLAAEAALVLQNPLRLRLRSQEACDATGNAGPFTDHGPSCLLDALVHWHREHRGEEDLLVDEEHSGELIAQGANAVVDSIDSGLAWLLDHMGSKVTVEKAQLVRRSLESLFCDCLTVDGTLPSRFAASLLVEGAFNANWKPPPPEKPRLGALARLLAKRVAKRRAAVKKTKAASKASADVKKRKKAPTRERKR